MIITNKLKRIYRILFPLNIVYIYSYGGSGTRMFYEWVKKYKPVNGQDNVHYDQIRHKHDNQKVIFLYGNPKDAVRSFYRRDYTDNKFIKLHCQHLTIPEVSETTLEDYIENGTDSFYLRSHLHRFVLSSNYDYDILFVKFDELWNNLEVVLNYIGLQSQKDNFPERKTRMGSSIQLSDELEKKFNKIYQEMEDEVKPLPPVCIFRNGEIRL